jgi:hypothetical protein
MAFKADLKTAFTANFDSSTLQRVVNSFASAYGYQATINGQPNPQTKGDFAADQIIAYIKNIVQGEETKAAQAAVAPVVPPTII